MSEAAPETGTDTGTPPPAATDTAPVVTKTEAAPAKDWRESIREDLRADPSIAKFLTAKDMQEFTNTVAQSYVHSSKMHGRDKVPIPKEGEDWSDFYKAAGRPDDPNGYELKPPADLPEGFYDADSAESFKAWAHDAGLNKSQAAKLHDQFVTFTAEQAEAEYTNTMAELQAGSQALKAEWGNAFESKVKAAERVATELGGEDFAAYLEETGLGNDPRMIKALAKVAEMTKGDGDLVGRGADEPMTPLQLDGEIATFREANNAALMDKFHPGHNGAVAKLQALYNKRFPPKSAVA